MEALLDKGWEYHDTESERLARELEDAARDKIEPGQFAPLLHLSNHTIGEHLSNWPRARNLAERVLKGETPTAETAKAWGRLHVAHFLAGDPVGASEAELVCLKASGAAFGAALLDMRFMLAAAMAGSKRSSEAALIYGAALALARTIEGSSALDRSIAAASNNLGWELYEMASRLADEDRLMQLAADTSHEFWLKCGNWVNEESALYLKALVANAMGDPKAALAHADGALAVISANGERSLDYALLHLVQAVALEGLGDANGQERALAIADAAAAKLGSPDLKSRYESERTSSTTRKTGQ